MRERDFIAIVEEIVVPVLEPYGFQRVQEPDGWITAVVLLESDNRWSSASWDWRDRYLDVVLGRLFLFRDVLPRVIVRGPLSVARTCEEESEEDFVRNALRDIASRVPRVLERFEELYPPSVAISEAVRGVAPEFLAHLGPEISLEEWRQLAVSVDFGTS